MDYVKDPQAKLDYTRSWASWLQASETIATSTWTVQTGLTQSVSPAASNTTTTATVWLEGGTHGQEYTVANRITTNQGRTDERTWIIGVRHR